MNNLHNSIKTYQGTMLVPINYVNLFRPNVGFVPREGYMYIKVSFEEDLCKVLNSDLQWTREELLALSHKSSTALALFLGKLITKNTAVYKKCIRARVGYNSEWLPQPDITSKKINPKAFIKKVLIAKKDFKSLKELTND